MSSDSISSHNNVNNILLIILIIITEELTNEAEYLMKNCGVRGGCYPSRP